MLARSGGSIFEIAAAGDPAILVPYPYAAGRHQHANAAWMADAGAAVVIEDDELDPPGSPRSRVSCSVTRRGSSAMAAASPAWRDPTRAADRGRGPGRAATLRAMSDAGRGRPFHFIAIGGAGMSGLALVCHRRGARGDRQGPGGELIPRAPRAAGSSRGSATTPTVPEGAEVVVSTAIPETTPSWRSPRRGQRIFHRGELLAELCAERRLIAVAGTHGKTTTPACSPRCP